jgi:hypothetical protein
MTPPCVLATHELQAERVLDDGVALYTVARYLQVIHDGGRPPRSPAAPGERRSRSEPRVAAALAQHHGKATVHAMVEKIMVVAGSDE